MSTVLMDRILRSYSLGRTYLATRSSLLPSWEGMGLGAVAPMKEVKVVPVVSSSIWTRRLIRSLPMRCGYPSKRKRHGWRRRRERGKRGKAKQLWKELQKKLASHSRCLTRAEKLPEAVLMVQLRTTQKETKTMEIRWT